MNRYALRDDQWERIKDLLPGKPGDACVTAHDNRRFVEAVLYRYRTGFPWRDLPERLCVWQPLCDHLAADADNEYAMIDSTIVRAHQHSAGAPKKRRRSSNRPQQGR